MKTLIFHHSADLDGLCSGAVVKLRYPDAILIGYDYYQPFPFEMIDQGDTVIMIDVSMDMPDMLRINELSDGMFLWIDHHVSAINKYNAYKAEHGEEPFFSFTGIGAAACELAWEYYFPNRDIPPGVLLLGQYDTWRNSDAKKWEEEILPFQFGARLAFDTAEKLYHEFYKMESPAHIGHITAQGKVVLQYQRQYNRIQASGAFEQVFHNLPAICINGGYNSLVFESVYDPAKYKLMILFRYDGSHWKVSLYSDQADVDCSVIAGFYPGGGGHKGAAGFRIEGLVCPFQGPKVEKKTNQ